MAASPKYKVYRGKEYVASLKYAEDAAKFVGDDVQCTVRLGHSKILWDEGSEELSASESYDTAAAIMRTREPVIGSS